ncbi:PREDICTED: uncharacterized protein LOC107193059 [Dufourea novaeangliae]|uniref:uncharacterized protein LOC107193059 n=1 Tax=Dufourea novaeangliae TaxID=178035 RepID=UPI0007677F45|nr:PREDICTED: uncharacterized protein LOC107193059 [Dufourea novaeangliae]
MKTPTNKDFDYAMTPIKVLSWPVGTWPLQTYNFVSGLRCAISIVLLLLMLLIVNTEMYLDHSDPEKNLDALLFIACGILAIWKTLCFRVCCSGLVSNFTSALKDYNELLEQEKRTIVRQHAKMGRIACASVIFFSYLDSTIFTTIPMLAGEDEVAFSKSNVTQEDSLNYPIPSEVTLKFLQVPESLYVVIYITEYLFLLITSTGNLGGDSLFFGIMFHLCGQAEVLKVDFDRFVEGTENLSQRFNALVLRHQELLRLSEQLNETISLVMVIQLFLSCILICTTEGFQCILSLSNNNIVMTVKTFSVVTTLLIQLFAYSYIGEYMKNQFDTVGYRAYCSDWYNIPCDLSRDIIFVLMRSQNPVQLKAGSFFVVNMETYMGILKTSMSYLSVLRVMVTS